MVSARNRIRIHMAAANAHQRTNRRVPAVSIRIRSRMLDPSRRITPKVTPRAERWTATGERRKSSITIIAAMIYRPVRISRQHIPARRPPRSLSSNVPSAKCRYCSKMAANADVKSFLELVITFSLE
jgi:hypothetical protein